MSPLTRDRNRSQLRSDDGFSVWVPSLSDTEKVQRSKVGINNSLCAGKLRFIHKTGLKNKCSLNEFDLIRIQISTTLVGDNLLKYSNVRKIMSSIYKMFQLFCRPE